MTSSAFCRGRIAACLLAAVALASCGQGGIERHAVEGTVTFGGNAVEAGQLMFEPDASVGAVAPTGFAKIEDGAFKIERHEGPVAGQYRFRVVGYDRARIKKAGGEVTDVPMLFPEFVTSVTIPVPEGKLDIKVPATGAGRR